MGPAQAMGTFLRVWRSEWARLTRAQLAIALHAVSHKTRGVTPRVIRRWEEGQPPSTTEELDALLQTMRRHGLSQPEVKQFRTAVYAACLDHHYPEAFASEDFAQRPDVDEAAQSLHSALQDRAWESGVVQGVACLEALRGELRLPRRPGPPQSQQRRQEMALALLHHGIAFTHGRFGRYALANGAVDAATAIVEERFNGRLTNGISSGTLHVLQLVHAGSLTWTVTGKVPMVYIPKLLELHRQGVVQGDPQLQAQAISKALDLLSLTLDPEWPAAVRSLEDATFASLAAAGISTEGRVHCHLANAAIEVGDWAAAERHVQGLECWLTDGGAYGRYYWENFMGEFARKRGDWAEATGHLERTLPLADQIGDHGRADWNRVLIRDCHEQQEKANRRRSKSHKPAEPAAE